MRGRYHNSVICIALSPPRSPSVLDDDVFSAAVLEKLPLADAVWRLLHLTLDDS